MSTPVVAGHLEAARLLGCLPNAYWELTIAASSHRRIQMMECNMAAVPREHLSRKEITFQPQVDHSMRHNTHRSRAELDLFLWPLCIDSKKELALSSGAVKVRRRHRILGC